MVYVLDGRAKCPACGGHQFKWAPLVEHETAILTCSQCRHVTSLSDARRAGEARPLAGGSENLVKVAHRSFNAPR
jgi:hypothetical protein